MPKPTSENAELKVQLEVARKALEFYSESTDYPLAVYGLNRFKICRDMGYVARQAIAQIDAGQKGGN